MHFLLTLLVVFSLGISAHGQTSPEAKPDVEDLLIQANLKKALASREIDHSPDRVAGEVVRVMAEMDRLFQEQIQELFEAHYKRVEETLQTVSLPKDVAPWKSSGSNSRQGCMIRATWMPWSMASSTGHRPRLRRSEEICSRLSIANSQRR